MDTSSEHIERLQDAMVRTRATASSADEGVTVEVGADGTLYAIRLGKSAEGLSQRELVDAVRTSHNDALADAIARLHEIAEELAASEVERSPSAEESTVSADEPSSFDEVPSADETFSTVEEYDDPAEFDQPEEVAAPPVALVPDDYTVPDAEPLPSYPDSHVIRPGAEPDDDARYAVILEEPSPRRRVPPPRRATRPTVTTRATTPADVESKDARTEHDPMPYPAWLDPAFLDPEAETREAEDFDILSDPLWDNWHSDPR